MTSLNQELIFCLQMMRLVWRILLITAGTGRTHYRDFLPLPVLIMHYLFQAVPFIVAHTAMEFIKQLMTEHPGAKSELLIMLIHFLTEPFFLFSRLALTSFSPVRADLV